MPAIRIVAAIAVSAVVTAAFAIDTLWFAPERSTRAQLESARLQFDPAKIAHDDAFNDYVRRATLMPTGIETGVIKMTDGTTAKYWFQSHHASDGIGGTLFELGDGSVIYMSGYFCCEVQLPVDQIASTEDLREFVLRHNGIPP